MNPTKTNHQYGLLLAVVLLAAFDLACGSGGAEPVAQAPAEVPAVAATRTVRADLASSLALTAEFEPYQEVDVMAKVSGYLKEIRVDLGDRVQTGQVLATLQIPEMEDDMAKAAAAIDEATSEGVTARSERTRAASARDMAHLSYGRLLDVSKREPGLIPQQEVDEARSRDLVADAQLASTESRIKSSEEHIRVLQSELARIKTLQQYTVITAPFDGVVTKRYANVGSMIQSGTSSQTQAMPLIRLSQNDLLRLMLPVPESAVSTVRVGQTVTVHVASMGRNFGGKVTRFSGKVQMATRTMDTEVDVPNADLTLLPGIYAQVDLSMVHHDRALCVPPDAIEGIGSATQRVYRVDGDGLIRIVPVTTGIENAQWVEVLSGLSEADTVVVGRRTGLAEGSHVRPKLQSGNASGGTQ